MNILITGIEGFTGSHLAELLLSEHSEYRIHGTRKPKASLQNIQHIKDQIQLHEVDITDESSVFSLLEMVRPSVIWHLAAQSYVRTSWESPQATLITNILGQANILETLRQLKTITYNPVIIIPGSSEEYGLSKRHKLPIQESAELLPGSPYAVSKIGQDYLGFQYWHTYQLNIIRLRVFNHTGPRRPTAFGDSHLAHTIALIEQGLVPAKVTYRDLSAVRDFTDVRDIARAYVAAVEFCQPGEVYNVCSGRGTKIKEIYETMLVRSEISPIELKLDPAGPRPTDGGIIIGDNTKFRLATGWQPKISFLNKTIPDLMSYWREHVTHETINSNSRIQR